MGVVISYFDKCCNGCKWREYDGCCSSKCFDMEPYTDYISSEKKLNILEQKYNQLQQSYTEIYENNNRLHNKCIQLEEKDGLKEKFLQKLISDLDQLTKKVELVDQRVSSIHSEKLDNVETDFIVIA
jgi:predicted nuclease with TOPRIM domain